MSETFLNYYDIELNENDKIIQQNEKIKLKMKPHQLTALYKAIDMENNQTINYKITNNHKYNSMIYMLYGRYFNNNNIISISTNVGIFGDMVGYGKTLTALGLIATNDLNNIKINDIYSKNFVNNNSYSYLNISTKNLFLQQNINNFLNTTLIIVPRGPVYIQWLNMIKNYTSLKVLAIDNINFIKKSMPIRNNNNVNEIIDYFNSFDIILIKNTTIKLLYSYYGDIITKWKRIIIDEAHDIIRNISIDIKYNYLWLISGTYEDLIKNFHNYSNNILYSNITKELFNNEFINLMLIKNNTNFIKKSFDLPEPIEKYYLCKLSNNINIIKNFITDNILDKINAGDIIGAIKELGGKNEKEDDIIELVLKELKRELFNKEAEKNNINSMDISNETKLIKLKNIDNEIQQQEEKINNLKERISYISTKNCSICMDLITNPIMIECTHIFCGGCLLKWLKNNRNCPYCRNNINNMNKLIAIVDNNYKEVEKENIYSKEETLLKIIKDKPDGKFLIFSKNENSFEKIKHELIINSLNYELLKGNTTHMMNVLNKFKNGDVNIILLNTQYAGSGIDISDATDIIIFHNMGNDKNQAVGRAQRVGRTNNLFIHNLCYSHELN